MYTRSKANHQLFEKNVYIDFDEASDAWKSNKKSIGNGCYKYICCQKTKQNKNCKRESLPSNIYCSIHCKSQ